MNLDYMVKNSDKRSQNYYIILNFIIEQFINEHAILNEDILLMIINYTKNNLDNNNFIHLYFAAL